MKKSINVTLLLCFVIIFGFMGLANAQRVIPIAPTAFGIINTTIEGDTLPDGNRVDPNTIYELERGLLAYYVFNGTINNSGYHLHIRAAAGEGDRPKLVPGVLEGGVSSRLFSPNGDVTLEGLYMTVQDNSNIFSGDKRVLRIGAEGVRITVDDCHFHGTTGSFMRTDAADCRIFVTNTIFSYAVLNGRGIDRRGNNLDSLSIQNCTFYNFVSRPVRVGGDPYAKYIKIDHVTYCNLGEEVSQLGEVVDVTFTNNMIINPGYLGTDDDGSTGAYFNELQPLSSPDLEGLTQSVKFRNNNLWLNPEIVNVFATLNSGPNVQYPVVKRIMADSLANLLIDTTDFMNEAITFTSGPNEDTLIALIRNVWEVHDGDEDFASFMHNGPEGVDIYADPLYGKTPFDFSYSTSAASYTAADNGLPLGDLNWFPDKKAEWELTSIEPDPIAGSPSEFRLSQNYPNPFNPTTNITYNLARKTDVKLSIYNTVGQKVATLVDKEQAAGSKTITWNGTDDNGVLMASGVYFYQLNAGEFNQTKKMLFLK